MQQTRAFETSSISNDRTPKPRKLRDIGVRQHRRNGSSGDRSGNFDRAHPVMTVVRVPRKRLVPGAVLWARIDFADADDYKVRPVVVLDRQGDIVAVHPCTTSPRSMKRPGVVVIGDLAAAGLVRPTAVRSNRLMISVDAVVAVSGFLSADDLRRVIPVANPTRPISPAALGAAA